MKREQGKEKDTMRLRFLFPRARRVLRNRKELFELLQKALGLMTSKKGLDEVRGQGFTLVNLVKDRMSGRYKDFSWTNLVLIVAGLIYLVSPIDFIPDFILGIGYADDVAVILYIMRKLSGELDKYKLWSDGQMGP